MKIILVTIFYLALCSPAFTAERNVVVIPLNSSQADIAGEGIGMPCYIVFQPGEDFEKCILDPVPPGKIMVVEFISGQLTLPAGQNAHVRTTLTYPAGGGGLRHILFLRYQRDYLGKRMYIVSQPVKLYIDEGCKVGIQASRTASSDPATGDFWLTGYLIDKK